MGDVSIKNVVLIVGGVRYAGWKKIRITRSIESLAGSFSLDVSDRWDGQAAPWPIAEGDPCRVEIDGEVVIDGHINKRSLSASKTSRSLSYSGRDRAAKLVDCSAVLSAWTYRNVDVAGFITALAKPFGVKVSVQPGLKLAKVPKIVVSPGDKVQEAIKKAADDEGVLLVSDGAGGVLITRSGDETAYSLVEGENIETAAVEYDGTDRFYEYVILAQNTGSDEASGDATRILAEAFDEGVTEKDRVLLIRAEKAYSVADARRRADWEARTRAARAESPTIGVVGWRQGNGVLWTPNATTHVTAPRAIGVDGDMLISQVDYSIDDEGGQVTVLKLVRPDAFEPEPKAIVDESGGLWKELDKGGT